MQIFGINLNTKADLNNIKSLLKLGEIIEVNVISKKGENLYILRIKGNLFEGLSTKKVDNDKLRVLVESVEPNIVLKSEDDKDLQINLKAFFKKSSNLESHGLSMKDSGAMIKAENNTEKSSVLFNKGDVIKAEVILQKDPSTYILKIDKTSFEALANLNDLMQNDKLTLLVEQVSPNIVLKVIGKNRDKIEYVRGNKGVYIESKQPDIESISNALKAIDEAIDLNSKNVAIVNTQKALNVLNKMEMSAGRLKGFIEKLKNLSIENGDGSKENIMKIINVAQEGKADISLNKLIEDLANLSGDRIVNMDMEDLEDSTKEIESFFNTAVIFGEVFTGADYASDGFLGGFLQELSKGLDKILNNITRVENSIKELENALLNSKMTDAKKITAKTKELMKNSLMNTAKQAERKPDMQKMMENIKNVIQQVKIPANTENLFIQIPIFMENNKSEIYVIKEKSEDSKNGAKSFKVKVAADMGSFGFIQIDGIYFDGKISCSIGLDKKDNLEKLNENIGELQSSLGKNVSLSTFLIKSKPSIHQKKLNIKI